MQAAWWERDRSSKRTHVRRNTRPMRYWGTAIPGERPGASRRSSLSEIPTRPICMCLCVLPFVQRRSIHIRSNLMGLVCRAKLRRNPSIWPWTNQVANESWRPAIKGICYRDEARYICHVSSALSRFSRTRSRYIKNFDSTY